MTTRFRGPLVAHATVLRAERMERSWKNEGATDGKGTARAKTRTAGTSGIVATDCHRLPTGSHGKECDEEGPPRVTGSGLSSGSYREEARLHVVRRFGSQSQAPRFPSARR